jgi:pimeloyl-ACP methyl ester carboxylesterase
VAGCGGKTDKPDTRAGRSPRPAVSTATVAPLAAPATRCAHPGPRARVVTFRTRDGVTLDGVEIGSGRSGAVLLHEVSGDVCDWWPLAGALVRGGVHALLIDERCSGRSACPLDSKRLTNPSDDVAAAIALLRRRGATRVTVAGASLGGAAALIAGARLRPHVQAVASLSGVTEVNQDLRVSAVIDLLRAPLLMAVARADEAVSIVQTRAMLRRAGSPRKALLVLPASAGHGIQLLLDGDDRPTGVFSALVQLIRTGRLPDR